MAEKNKQPTNPEKTRYSDEEYQEFREIINKKLVSARKELGYLQEQIRNLSGGPDNKLSGLEDGTGTLEKEYLNQMAARQMKYIKNLENALIRIQNKAYGVCRVTKKLISKERLRVVPHATLSIDAKKQMSKDNTRAPRYRNYYRR